MRHLGAPAEGWSTASAINDRAQVVGISSPNSTFLWQNGKRTTLGRVPIPYVGMGAWPWEAPNQIAINERGQIAGTLQTGAGKSRAFSWMKGRMTYLALPRGADASVASAISESGQIVRECLH